MISLAEAKQIASAHLANIHSCAEFANAWVFSNSESRFSIGGPDMPVVVMKETGEICDTITFYDKKAGKFIDEYPC